MSNSKPFTDEVRAVIQGFVLMIRVDKSWQFAFDFSQRGFATSMAAACLSTLLLSLLAWAVGAGNMPVLFGAELLFWLVAKYLVLRIYLELNQRMSLFMPTFILLVWFSALLNGLYFDVFVILAVVNAIGLPDTVSLFLIMLFFFPLFILGIVLMLRILRLGAGASGAGAIGLGLMMVIIEFMITSAITPILVPDQVGQVEGLFAMLGIDPQTLGIQIR